MEIDTDAYLFGMNARRNGFGIDDNPFDESRQIEKSKSWEEGWKMEEAILRDAEQLRMTLRYNIDRFRQPIS